MSDDTAREGDPSNKDEGEDDEQNDPSRGEKLVDRGKVNVEQVPSREGSASTTNKVAGDKKRPVQTTSNEGAVRRNNSIGGSCNSNNNDKNDEKNDDDNNNNKMGTSRGGCISRRPKKPRRAVITAHDIAREGNVPSRERLTANGGYAATAAHRRKIAVANAGKEPWNKGRHRSQADRDKIKAAVVARNRRILLANLATIGVTEEEHASIKKRIKVMRENVRKTKMAIQKQLEADATETKRLLKLQQEQQEIEQQREENEEEQRQVAAFHARQCAAAKAELEHLSRQERLLQEKIISIVQQQECMKRKRVEKRVALEEQQRQQQQKHLEIEKAVEESVKHAWKMAWEEATAGQEVTAADTAAADASTKASSSSETQFASIEQRNNIMDDQDEKKNGHRVWEDGSSQQDEDDNGGDGNGDGDSDDDDHDDADDNESMDVEEQEDMLASSNSPCKQNKGDNDIDQYQKEQQDHENDEEGEEEGEGEQYNIEAVPEMFRRDFEWTPHAVFRNGEVPLSCPTGGPGGLICCEDCATAYADYLSSTYDELEQQKVAKVAAELDSITHFITLNQERLTESIKAAQGQPPPTTLGYT